MRISPKKPGRFFAGCAILWGWFWLFIYALAGGSEGHVGAASEADRQLTFLACSIPLAVFVLGAIISFAMSGPTRHDLANHLRKFLSVVGVAILVIVSVILLIYCTIYFSELPK